MELDEMSKEDFFRLKKVLDNKKRIADAQLDSQTKQLKDVADMESDNILNQAEE
jgi:hypothetical protein